jgi:4'-phosphopantetheinyl transferase
MSERAGTNVTAHDDAIDLWIADDQALDAGLQARCRRLLTAEERAQEQRFHFVRDQRRYLVTRALVRTVLSRYVGVAPEDWRFVQNRYGRPEVINIDPARSGLRFNISHSQGLVVLAVAWHREVGVDVENVRARRVSLDIAERFFAPAEAAELARVPPQRRHDRFFEYWTFKESYIKARGAGLSIPLEQFSFRFPNERTVRLAIQPQLRDDARRWAFWQLRPTPEHLLALCAERRAVAPKLTLRRALPLVGEQLIPAQVFKASESVEEAAA